MAVWDELRVALTELLDSGALKLAPWAVDIAADFYRRFGDDVDLRVGALGYPDRRPVEFAPTQPGR